MYKNINTCTKDFKMNNFIQMGFRRILCFKSETSFWKGLFSCRETNKSQKIFPFVSKFFALRVRSGFGRAFSSREINKSQKLFPFVRLAVKHGDLPQKSLRVITVIRSPGSSVS